MALLLRETEDVKTVETLLNCIKAVARMGTQLNVTVLRDFRPSVFYQSIPLRSLIND
jgi:hypothetical protein